MCYENIPKLIYYYGIKMNNNDNHYSKMLSSLLSLMFKSPSFPLYTLPNKEVNGKIINMWSFKFYKGILERKIVESLQTISYYSN